MANEANGIIIQYNIYVSAEEDFAFSMANDTVSIDDANVLEFLFTNLEEFVNYTFEISAFTAIGEGPTSPGVTNMTNEAGITHAELYPHCSAYIVFYITHKYCCHL